MRCFYDGGHGDVPGDGVADQITVWFLLQYHLDTVSLEKNEPLFRKPHGAPRTFV